MKAVPGMERIEVSVNESNEIEIVQTSWTGDVVTIHIPDEYMDLFIKAVKEAREEGRQ